MVEEPVYLVDVYSEPVCLKINGRASYTNCAPLTEFFTTLIKRNKRHFAVDFTECSGMDSTFLGLIAGFAMELRRPEINGSLTLSNLHNRNLELVRKLGLHRILKVEQGRPELAANATSKMTFTPLESDLITDPELLLKAHQNLVAADSSNLKKFQDVMIFLKKQINQDSEPTS